MYLVRWPTLRPQKRRQPKNVLDAMPDGPIKTQGKEKHRVTMEAIDQQAEMFPCEKAKERGERERGELIEKLRGEGAVDLVAKLETCGREMKLVCACCGNRKSVAEACMRRWCPACAWKVQHDRIDRFTAPISGMKWPLFVTLTMPNNPDPECIRGLRKHWSKMRRRKLMKDKVTGGISTVEVTAGKGGWHPHLHILADCRWLSIHVPEPSFRDSPGVRKQKFEMAQRELSAIWGDVIKSEPGMEERDGAIVWVTRKNAGEALKYSLKYAVKGSDLISTDREIAPLIRVLSKSRMVSAFGDLHGKVQEDEEDEKPAVVCRECGNEKSFIPAEIIEIAMRQAYDKNNSVGSNRRKKKA